MRRGTISVMAVSARSEFVRFEATDRVVLPGLLFEPRSGAEWAVVWLHGNGDASVFYAERTIPLAEAFLRKRMAFFPFNNRGAYLVKKLTKAGSGRRKALTRGTGYELIRESVADIEGAVRFLRSRGHRRIVLMGHSSGANKICLYHYRRRRNPVAAFVLAGGGDDMGLYFEQWGRRRFSRMLGLARRRTGEGRGLELAPADLTPFPISWASLYDTINPEGGYNIFPFLDVMKGLHLSRKRPFREFRAIRKPTLVVYGENDEFCFGDVGGCIRTMQDQVKGREEFTFATVANADHGFHGKERELAETVTGWLRSVFKR